MALKLKPKINNDCPLIAYKLLNDLMFLMLIFFAAGLVADGMIPGIVSDHVSFLKTTLVTLIILGSIFILGNLSGVYLSNQKSGRKTTVFLFILAGLLIFNSLFKLELALALFISAFSLAAGYFIYKNILEEDV